MANVQLFSSSPGKLVPPADTTNQAGGLAYSMPPKHALAQYAATGCFGATFYASAEEQLEKVLVLCKQIEPEFVAKTAIFARERGHMKDMPAFLCAYLSARDPRLLGQIFARVIDDGKMLRNFVQIVRSGVVGRKSFGTMPRRLIRQWFEARSDHALFRASVGQSPSLSDIVKMVHPRPATDSRRALLGYLLAKEHKAEHLPPLVQQFEAFKVGGGEVPDVPFQMLTAMPLGPEQWASIARHASWQTTRMNLNTFARHKVFDVPGMSQLLAERLRDPAAVGRAKVFPYQLMMAYKATWADVPREVKEALQDAMEIAIQNVPAIDGKVWVFPDVSGSMSSAVTGARGTATSAVRCIDVAALVAAAILRRNPLAEVLPFEARLVQLDLNPRDSVMTNAQKLAAVGGGGTDCHLPLAFLNSQGANADLLVYVSDNESWVDSTGGWRYARHGTAVMEQWSIFKRRNPKAKLVCIDLTPNATVQAPERDDILNIGGFSDAVFEMIGLFARGEFGSAHWTGAIEAVKL